MKQIWIASLSTILIVFLLTFFVTAIDSIGNDFSDIRITLFISGVAALVGFIVLLCWVIPIHLLLNRLKQKHLGWYVLSAIMPSFAFIYLLKPFGRDTDVQLFQQALFCSFVGILGAVAFWYLTVHRQPISRNSNGSS